MDHQPGPLKSNCTQVLAREHVGGHDGAGRATRGAAVAPHAELVEGGRLVGCKDAADGTSPGAVPVQHEGRAGRGGGAFAARGDGRPGVMDAGRGREPVLDDEGEA